MTYEFTGKVIAICARRTGEGRNGAWASDGFVLEETNKQYPKKVKLDVFSTAEKPRWNEMDIKAGEVLKASFEIDARENNGNWWNSLTCWKVERFAAEQAGNGLEYNQGTGQFTAQAAPTPGSQTEHVANMLGAQQDAQSNLPF